MFGLEVLPGDEIHVRELKGPWRMFCRLQSPDQIDQLTPLLDFMRVAPRPRHFRVKRDGRILAIVRGSEVTTY